MADAIISRKDARAQGLKRYFTGKPCPHGHYSQRQVTSGSCYECMRLATSVWREAFVDRGRAACQANYAKNSEARKAKAQLWYRQNRERVAEIKRAWAKANPERVRKHCLLKNHRRRARKFSAEGFHTASDLAAILVAQNGRCAYCRVRLSAKSRHIDHITPLALGGRNDRSNLQFACSACNLSKGAKDPVEYARSIGLLL